MSGRSQTKLPLTTSSLFSTSSSWIDDVEFLYFSPNFAHYPPPSRKSKANTWQRVPMQYEHEIYLQLTTGHDGTIEITANQRFLEERRQRMDSRSQDLAVSGPLQNCPSPTDFECAEMERIRAVERQRGGSWRSPSDVHTTTTRKRRPMTSSDPRTMATLMTREDWLHWI
ncbi:hypothetical protein AJ78_00374 [Emergomyces pasteurianus Ep9510]|uniref:Uncharacterized protein n=1 Tax=Emergomyces pasteurianus Ep9510 TaxID=1447872 RepID=A0A1J9PUS9_9EURO|nr:hypothetical protein AJ78_00374 [Emergomyces pasteurianus Ep9510]